MASSDSLSQPPLKNRKTVEGCFSSVETDRISMLPDDVICHILSFIPTKYSIRTSVLSKRWKNLWALSPNLVLEVFRGFLYAGFCNHFRKDDDIGNELRADSFVNSVDNLLLIRDCLHIENIKIFMSGKVLPSRVNFISWVYSIVMCTVRKLDIGVDFTATKDLGELSWCLFSCKTLMELKLSGRFVLNIPYYVCLPNLKTLVLKNVVYLGDSSIRKLLLGCPVLEDLEIERHEWDQMRTLYVSSSSLKRLKLYSCISGEVFYELGYAVDKKIVVDALNLEFIDIEDVWSGDIILKYVPNLVEAHITIELFEYTNNGLLLSNLLRSMAYVRRLYLSGVTLNILWYTEDPVLITFHNLVYLELYFSTRGPIQLMNLLRSCPKLEALFLPGGIDCEDDDGGVDNEFLENDPEQVPYCLRQNLKTVEIRRFVGEEFELNIVRYLLGNALVLKTMTIVWWWTPSDLDFVGIQTELTNFPRLSNDCKIDLLYR